MPSKDSTVSNEKIKAELLEKLIDDKIKERPSARPKGKGFSEREQKKTSGLMKHTEPVQYKFFPSNDDQVFQTLGKERALQLLKRMLLIRNFEIRGESAYQHGKIGGFYHAYIGQEAVQTSAVDIMGT